MTDKDNSQTGEYSYTYSYSYSKEGGEKNVEVHTGGFSAATAGEAAVDSTGKTTAGESSGGKSAPGKQRPSKAPPARLPHAPAARPPAPEAAPAPAVRTTTPGRMWATGS